MPRAGEPGRAPAGGGDLRGGGDVDLGGAAEPGGVPLAGPLVGGEVDGDRVARPCQAAQRWQARVARGRAVILSLNACIWHNWQIGAPVKRSLIAYDHV
jgi:hypothetical protein